jgi:hydroxyacylglutathione hydrolase
MLTFPSVWIHGSADCGLNQDPAFQVHAADADTFIFRQNKCHTFEAPFLYLLRGTERALLLDTGAFGSPIAALRQVVTPLVPATMLLVVAHTHSHGDHAFADSQFINRPNTTIVSPTLADVKSFFGFPEWPAGVATYDLGGRRLEIIPAPGHERSHLVVYDEKTKSLFTGDTLYPGLLVINDRAAYRATASRLRQFAEGRAIDHVLGAHVEMKRFQRELYEVGTPFQPDEHVLQLKRSHLIAWCDAVAAMGNSAQRITLDDFALQPA